MKIIPTKQVKGHLAHFAQRDQGMKAQTLSKTKFCFERTIYQQCTQRAYKRKDAFPIRRLERQLLKVIFQ